jgi:hypothetical protein
MTSKQRLDMQLFAADVFLGMLGAALLARPTLQYNPGTPLELLHEAQGRVHRMCGQPP